MNTFIQQILRKQALYRLHLLKLFNVIKMSTITFHLTTAVGANSLIDF